MREQTYIIRNSLINSIKSIDDDIFIPLNIAINELQNKFNISKQAINKHLLHLEKEGYLISSGKTNNKTYSLGKNREFSKTFKVDDNFDEFEVYNTDFYWVVEHLPKNIEEIVEWGFTEILNNVKDHSQAKDVFIFLKVINNKVNLIINDNGIGIFNNIKKHKNIVNNKQILLELSKGKLTTDKENHTGLGIFWSIKSFDEFGIYTDGKIYNLKDKKTFNLKPTDDKDVDNYMQKDLSTSIMMSINASSKTKLKDVFDNFALQPECELNTTILNLALISERNRLVSRSQAKQVVNRLEEFKFITFDFAGIESIGQGFADEIFRVFWKKYPTLELSWINTNEDIEKMIKLAINYDR